MKMTKSGIFITTALLILTAQAATAFEGKYIDLRGGIVLKPNQSRTFYDTGTSTRRNAITDFKAGYNFNVGLGYKSGLMRYALELGRQQNYIKSLTLDAKQPNPSGQVSLTSGLANVYYDMDTIDQNWFPYFGLGLGYAAVKHRLDTDTFTQHLSGAKGSVAGQATMGFGYRYTKNFSIQVDYRYFRTGELDYQIKDSLGSQQTLRNKYQSHNLNLGLNLYF